MESMISCDSDSLQGFLKSLPIRFGVGSIGADFFIAKAGHIVYNMLNKRANG